MSIKNIKDIEKFLAKHIPQKVEDNFFGEKGLDRVRYFANLLNNPQEKVKIIHVAGTSGKGSTATIISYILQGLGFKIGLQVSPHLLDIRERCQLNNSLLEERQFVKYFKEIIPAIEKMAENDFGQLTYFEIITILAWYIFEKEKVDYAIMETGLGGLYDASNIVINENKVVVLTKIGKDHTEVLGKTVREITEQKAGIIHKGNYVFSAEQTEIVSGVLNKFCAKNKNILKYANNQCEFLLSLMGSFQKKNCSLALDVVDFLGRREKFLLDKERMQTALLKIKFPGRFEQKQFNGKLVIFDGAHNVQKMTAFLRGLEEKYPEQKFDFLLAFKEKKDFSGMLKMLVKKAKNIVVTDFQKGYSDLGVSAMTISRIVKELKKLSYKKYEIIPDSAMAFEKCVNKENKEILVVTGSLYLISEIYKKYDKR
jgi:dihydrofolate synthase/folylpolyglutamate synthase